MRKNAPANRKNVRPTRDRACIARRPANSRYSDSTIDAVRCPFAPAIGIRRYTKLEPRALPLRSAPSSELALRLFQRHENLRNHAAQCVALHRLRCRVDACSNEERAVPRTRINFVRRW